MFPTGTVAACNGKARLHITFTGILNDQMAGFYRAKYTDKASGEVKVSCHHTDGSHRCQKSVPMF